MSMFWYYAFHSFVNQVRKLFKTWIAIFLAICIVFGLVIGIAVGVALSVLDKDEPSGEEPTESEPAEREPAESEPTEEEDTLTDEQVEQLLELIAGGVVFLVLFFFAFTADKSVSSLFLPADVPILFASPRKPQSILIFRLSMQIGVTLFSSVYLLFQLPNLVHNLGVSVWNAVALLLVWFFTLAWGKILQVFLYIYGSTHEKLKKNLRFVLFGLVAVIDIAFYRYYQTANLDLFTAACSFFNGRYGVLIPIWGWLKAIVVFGIRQQPLWQIAAVAGNIAAGALTVYAVWQMKADYYEEALTKCEKTAEMLAAASEGKILRKKDRSDKIKRDGLKRGMGANVYFHKALYNRFRFAHFGLFTKTAETYLAAGVLVSLAVRYLFHSDSILPTFAVIGVFSFFRSLGNPLQEDTGMEYFILIPESVWAKLWYSLLGGAANCALDLLPGMIAAAVLMKADLLTAISWFVLFVTLNFYSTCVGAFLDFSVSTSAGKPLKNVVQILFVYFGLLPDIACIVLAAVFSQIQIGILLAALVNCAVGGVFFALSPVFLMKGRK